MRRYLLFAGDKQYPDGGWRDFKGDFDSVQLAKIALETLRWEWNHIVDSETGEICAESYNNDH